MSLEISSISASQNQLAFAAQLGIEAAADVTAESLVSKVEQRLGQDSMLEQSRWFVMSVLRHLQQADWTDPYDSNLQSDRQYALARENIATGVLKKSLRTVLKDNRCKFTLVEFAKSRKPEKQVLSYATKAFSRASSLLEEAGLIDVEQKLQQQPEPEPADPGRGVARQYSSHSGNSVVSRRAARRGYPRPSSVVDILVEQSKQKSIGSTSDRGMSEEEYAELNRAFEDGDQQHIQSWNHPSNEDRISLALRVAAGFGVFAVVLWVLL